MTAFACDRCGRGLLTDADVRYRVKIEVVAAYDPLELTPGDLAGDHAGEIERLLVQLEGKSEEELTASVYKTFDLDLCATCHAPYLADPLGRKSVEGAR